MKISLVALAGVLGEFGDRQGDARPLEEHSPEWPKHIYMTYANLGRVPSYVHLALNRYARDYTVSWFDDSDCLDFMRQESPSALEAYRAMPNGAHRADMWRYHILRKRGGVYLDTDIVLKRPLDEVFPDRRMAYTVLSKGASAIFNAVLVSPPGNPIFDTLISQMVKTVLSGGGYTYDVFTQQFYTSLMRQPRATRRGWVLFQERCGSSDPCDGRLDKYGLCCGVYGLDGSLLMGSRYPDFPF